MINGNFKNQDKAAAQNNDASGKEANADQFSLLMAGFFPPEAAIVKAPDAATPEAGAETTDAFASTPGNETFAGGFCMEPSGRDLSKKKNPADTGGVKPLPVNDGGIEPGTPTTLPFTKNTATLNNSILPQNGAGEAEPGTSDRGAGDWCMDPSATPPPEKPIVKVLKMQGDKFQPVMGVGGPIANNQNFAALAKDKAALVKALEIRGAQVQVDSGTADTAPDSTAGQLPFTYVTAADPNAPVAQVISRKFTKLFNDISESFAVDNKSATAANIELQTAQPVAAKVRMVLEQVTPKMMELAASVVATVSGEKQIMKMRLHPAELGTVEIHLEKDASGTLSAHFKTDNEASRQILNKNLDQLRDALNNAGIQVGQMDASGKLSTSSDGSAGSRDAFQQAQQEQGRSGSGHSGSQNGADTKRSNETAKNDADRLVSLRA
jgi:hypothetical protein